MTEACGVNKTRYSVLVDNIHEFFFDSNEVSDDVVTTEHLQWIQHRPFHGRIPGMP